MNNDYWNNDLTLNLNPIIWDGSREQLQNSSILLKQKQYAISVLILQWKCYHTEIIEALKFNKQSHLHGYVLNKVTLIDVDLHKVNLLILSLCDMIDCCSNLPSIFNQLVNLRRKCCVFKGTVYPEISEFMKNILQ